MHRSFLSPLLQEPWSPAPQLTPSREGPLGKGSWSLTEMQKDLTLTSWWPGHFWTSRCGHPGATRKQDATVKTWLHHRSTTPQLPYPAPACPTWGQSSSFLAPFRARVSVTTHIRFNSRVACLVQLAFSCVTGPKLPALPTSRWETPLRPSMPLHAPLHSVAS